MAVFFFEGVKSPVIPFNYARSVAALGPCPDEDSVLTLMGGYFNSVLVEELLFNPLAEFSQEEQEALKPFLGKGVIWVDDAHFNTLKAEEKMGILLHEDAHQLLGHLENQKKGLIKDLRFELEADAYASEKVGKKAVRKALRKGLWLLATRLTGGKSLLKTLWKYILLLGNPATAARFKALR